MINIGSRVKVIDNCKCYNSYESWIDEHAPQYKHMWNCGDYHMNNGYYTVVASGEHEYPRYGLLYLISNGKQVYIIGEKGVEEIMEFTKADLKTGMMVKTRNNSWYIVQKEAADFEGRTDYLINTDGYTYLALDKYDANLIDLAFVCFDVIEVAEVDYIGNIFKAIENGSPIEDIKGFKVIYQRKDTRVQQLEQQMADLQKTIEEASAKSAEIQDEIRRLA